MNHKDLPSTNIQSTAWENGTLEVKFRNGAHYSYAGVPEKVHNEFRAADSAGRYFAANIRGRYPHQKLG